MSAHGGNMSYGELAVALEGEAERNVALQRECDRLKAALRELVARCDGEEGVREDGSNICTVQAHAALGDFQPPDPTVAPSQGREADALLLAALREVMRVFVPGRDRHKTVEQGAAFDMARAAIKQAEG